MPFTVNLKIVDSVTDCLNYIQNSNFFANSVYHLTPLPGTQSKFLPITIMSKSSICIPFRIRVRISVRIRVRLKVRIRVRIRVRD